MMLGISGNSGKELLMKTEELLVSGILSPTPVSFRVCVFFFVNKHFINLVRHLQMIQVMEM